MINLTINDTPVSVEENATILQAAAKIGIRIPTLCHFELDCFSIEHRTGSCRICVVEVEGRRNLAPACCTPVNEDMVVKTNTIRAINARRTMLDLILSDHPKECLTCEKNGDCELQNLASEMDLHHVMYEGEMSTYKIDLACNAIVRDLNKCIMCRRCETACNDVQTVGILSGVGRGFDAVVAPAAMMPLNETKCVFCGQCVAACPVGALTEQNNKYQVWQALNQKGKHVIVQTAPAVRVAIGEEFGMDPGSIATGKLVAGLRMLGFDKVFDTDFAADLTIMEETTELIERLTKNENLPILTSCCPGWVKFLEHQFPELVYMPSTAKSPQQMFGAIAKSYYAEKLGKKPEDIICVSVMPCLAKKYEASREEFAPEGVKDVDLVISTRELADMFKEAGIQLEKLEDKEYDNPLGESTGAAIIFGASGGVLEAALRTAADWLTGEDIKDIDFNAVRGLEGIKEATVNVAGTDVKVAVTSGLGNARKVLEKIQKGEAHYHAIEIMACPGGCLNGGGQPYNHGDSDILEKRKEAIYTADSDLPIRKSHENPHIKKLYDDYLEKPGSKLAHKLLHTHYTPRKNW
ncbi:MAG: 2Fe-2S iron-sulfur cluster binding domain-containing protein [Lentisphaerae bacterium]|nr:2Fe-2S iron-sulfur cluster binding domain-containing protein [Lentisphaerota bacterium]MCP4103383.1 2Fe-2S iron-sulfur cluster binding domain-containing protein [Lentisphaerota bacterium]